MKSIRKIAHKTRAWLSRKLFPLLSGRENPCGKNNRATRENWLSETLAAVPAGSRILDAGAGERKYQRFCNHLAYVSQDFAQYDGKGDGLGRQKGQWDQTGLDIISDITQIPEADRAFDAVICIEVLEHVPHPVDALRELARLLKPGGALILTAPLCSLTHYSPYFYYTGYSRNFYEYWLPKLGLEIQEMQWNGNYFEYLAQELRRLPKISEEYSRAPVGVLEKLATNVLLRALERMSRRGSGSEQLLAYGLHVLASKRPD